RIAVSHPEVHRLTPLIFVGQIRCLRRRTAVTVPLYYAATLRTVPEIGIGGPAFRSFCPIGPMIDQVVIRPEMGITQVDAGRCLFVETLVMPTLQAVGQEGDHCRALRRM